MNKIHLISFNIPYPANYGGVIDVFYKVKSLHRAGIKIHLHCFEYGRSHTNELNKYCESVTYYKRKNTITKQFSTLPFIVSSRNVKALLENLQKDEHPILFEGLHCCFFIDDSSLKHRKKIIRMHNVEWQYYDHLAKMEKDFLKKKYFSVESQRLKRFEKKVKKADVVLAISHQDLFYFNEKYPDLDVQFIPAFHSNDSVDILTGRGEYVLFHGDLSVKDNEEAAIWLLKDVFQNVDYQLIIAGLNPTENLKSIANTHPNASLEANVSEERMQELIQNAHVNVLLSFQSAGMKLKLLNALYRGRFCVVNYKMVSDERLAELCHVKETATEIRNTLNFLFGKKFEQEEIEKRKNILESSFSNDENGNKIKEIIFSNNQPSV